jgi:hypothetical protein
MCDGIPTSNRRGCLLTGLPHSCWRVCAAGSGRSYADRVDLEFSGEVWFWRGPSPYHFVTVPEDESAQLQATAAQVTYGWGMIPVEARIGSTRWTTSLFPKDGGYLVPLKDKVRHAEQVDVGDTVTLRLTVDV